MSKWWFPYTLTPEQEAAGLGSDTLPETYPEGAVRGLADDFFRDLFEKRKKCIDHETQYCMFPVYSSLIPFEFAENMTSREHSRGPPQLSAQRSQSNAA